MSDDDGEIEADDTDESSGLVAYKDAPQSQRLDLEDDRPAVGSWWWLKSKAKGDAWKPADYDEPGRKWLACVIEVGSNYAKLQGTKFHQRVALDDFHTLCKPERNPEAYTATKVGFHKTKVRELTGEIQRVCALIGVPMRDALAAAENPEGAQGLALVHGTADINAYEKALVKAKDKTLPELFKAVKEQHEAMAKWMKADLIPLEAQLDSMKGLTRAINAKIQMVELYAGLTEKLVCVLDGNPAPNDTKVTLMQRRAYMDEECLIRYEAGGMSFKNIEAFDKWLARREHMTRILPHERCIVAFRIRRWAKSYDGDGSLESFISFQFATEENKATFLYIRNGDQLWRLRTAIEFGSQLFPNRTDNDLLNDTELWVQPDRLEHDWPGEPGIITRSQRNQMIESWQENRRSMARKLWAWKRAGKPSGEWTRDADGQIIDTDEDRYWTYVDENGRPRKMMGRPDNFHNTSISENLDRDPTSRYQLLTPDNIYYDDTMRKIRATANEHNRVAIVMQGLLDRSTCLHPHPPWKLFTQEGFTRGIELVYDDSRAITPGAEPDWEDYKKQLNKSIGVGSYVLGQYPIWAAEVGIGEGRRDDWKIREKHGDGPRGIARIREIRGKKAKFSWTRSRLRGKKTRIWIPSKTRGPNWGHYKVDYSDIPVHWWCPLDKLFCINAYTPGDFHIFYDDPRTRADYIKWAPYLLAAEDWHHHQKQAPNISDGETDDEEKEDSDDED